MKLTVKKKNKSIVVGSKRAASQVYVEVNGEIMKAMNFIKYFSSSENNSW